MEVCRGVRRAQCEFMGADAGVIILIAGFIFAGIMVLALVGVFQDDRIGLVKDKPGRKKRGGTPPAQREPIRMAGETKRMSVRFVHKVSL